jgi:hypothetical protein
MRGFIATALRGQLPEPKSGAMKISLKEASFANLIDSGFCSVRPERYRRANGSSGSDSWFDTSGRTFMYFRKRGLEEYSGLDIHHFHHARIEPV